jgi:hypothetical protein
LIYGEPFVTRLIHGIKQKNYLSKEQKINEASGEGEGGAQNNNVWKKLLMSVNPLPPEEEKDLDPAPQNIPEEEL